MADLGFGIGGDSLFAKRSFEEGVPKLELGNEIIRWTLGARFYPRFPATNGTVIDPREGRKSEEVLPRMNTDSHG